MPSGSKSGILFSFTAKQLSQIGVDLGFDDIVADYMCENLFFGVVGDCDDYRRFKKAYNEGLDYIGIPLDRAIGDPLAVEVLRHCPGDVTPACEVTSKYGGIAGNRFGVYDPVFGGYAYYVPLLYAQSNDFNSVMYIQNGGLECSSVEIWFKAQDDCLRARICEVFTLAPGETYQFDANDCVGPDFQGSAWLRSSQPLGVVVDIFGKDVLMTYKGMPSELNYTFDPSQATFTIGQPGGLRARSSTASTRAGTPASRCRTSPASPRPRSRSTSWTGAATSSRPWWTGSAPAAARPSSCPSSPAYPATGSAASASRARSGGRPATRSCSPPNIGGIATLIKYTDAARTDAAEAIAYNLLSEELAFDWQIGAAAAAPTAASASSPSRPWSRTWTAPASPASSPSPTWCRSPASPTSRSSSTTRTV